MKSLTVSTLIMVLLSASGHAGIVRQQDHLDMTWERFDITPIAFAAALNLGSGKFCIVSTVDRPHLLPQSLDAAEAEDLNSSKQTQEMVNSMMSQYPVCTQKQEEKVERLAANIDKQQVAEEEEQIAININVPLINMANPQGIFNTIFFPENITLFNKRGQILLSESDKSGKEQSSPIQSSSKLFDPNQIVNNAIGGCVGGAFVGTVATLIGGGPPIDYGEFSQQLLTSHMIGVGVGGAVLYFVFKTPLINTAIIMATMIPCKIAAEHITAKRIK